MHILQFTASNIKRLKVVSITPKGNIVQISGRNRSGKTSVLDAISLAIEGLERGGPTARQIIREGADQGEIELDLGEYTVTRIFTERSKNLVVKSKDGSRLATPQELLNSFMGKLGFDPYVFLRMEPKEQVRVLQDLIKFDGDTIDAEIEEARSKRTDTNRELGKLQAQLAGTEEPVPDLPAQPIDVTEIADRLQSAITHNAAVDVAKTQAEGMVRESQTHEANARARRAHIEQLRKQIAEDERAEAEDLKEAERLMEWAKAIQVHNPIDTQDLAEQIKNAQATNAQIAKRDQRQSLTEQVSTLQGQMDTYNETIRQGEAKKAEAVSKAKLPIKGLSFATTGDRKEVTYNGFPLKQASTSEQLRVSVGIAMAANPKLKVIRISDGSLLDDDSFALLVEMAEKHDYQMWIEKVDTTGEVGIVMEDGEVAKVNEPPAKAEPPVKKKRGKQ